jgi:signal transduction histidine kinase
MSNEDTLVRSLLNGLAVFRGLAAVWLVVLLAVDWDALDRPVLAIGLAAAAVAVTITAAVFNRKTPARLLEPWFAVTEVAVAAGLAFGDSVVYDGPHSQSLGSAWPLAGILTAGVGWGVRGGVAAGAAVGLGRLAGDVLDSSVEWTRSDVTSAGSTIVLYVFAGLVAGLATGRLRRAERQIASARAREEVARTLHDGVLQTLAVVQRRVDDPELATLAREQEQDLREYLFGTGVAAGGGDLGSAIRGVARRIERHHGLPVSVVMTEEVSLSDEQTEALVGAVGEALTNAAKHARASRATVFVEPDGTKVFCSVKDDGDGFDPDEVTHGIGLDRSITARITEVGGSVEVAGNPGRGAELRFRM